MKIALDATYSLGRNLSGVGVYSREILFGLAKQYPESRFKYCYRPHRYFRSFAERLPVNASRRLLFGGRTSADLFHGLNQRIDSGRYRRTVSTFHDLFFLTGEYSTPEFRRRMAAQARQAAERSDLVITVSDFTARQVEGLLKIDRSRIRVIAHGVRKVRGRERPREQIILFVGAIQRRKNIARLVEAFQQVSPGWQLVLAGSTGYGAAEILAHIDRSPRRQDIQLLGYVDDQVLEELYQRASVFAFPSLDEGFGMPLLDAMARSVPIVTSNVSALPEVAGDAAVLVDPLDVSAIAQALVRLTEDVGLRENLIQKGLTRSRAFSWERAVEQTARAYQELLG